jgi:sporulation protein YlmC with PRC-barrel domain
MRLAKDLENKPIISVTDGQILGRTKDVYVDEDLAEIAGLYVGTEGVLRRKEKIIPSSRIVLFGVDVILVKDADVITTTDVIPESDRWHRLDELHGRDVYTPGGTKLATIDDATLDEKGAVSGFTLSRVFVSGPLSETPFIPRDVIVDAFKSSDALLIDFPKLEALFAAPEAEKSPDAAAASEPLVAEEEAEAGADKE